MKRDKEMILKPLKTREGVGHDVKIRWDLDAMEFPELEVMSNTGGGDADEFGTSVEKLGDKSDKGLNTKDDDEVPF